MAYATDIQFVARVGEAEARALATPTPLTTPGYVAATINGALSRATATLNTYLATRFDTPLNPVPDVVKDAVITLAREDLDRQGRDHVTKDADRVRAWAKDVSRGTATLGVPATAEDAPAPAGDGGGVLIDAPDRVFDGNGLSAYLAGS